MCVCSGYSALPSPPQRHLGSSGSRFSQELGSLVPERLGTAEPEDSLGAGPPGRSQTLEEPPPIPASSPLFFTKPRRFRIPRLETCTRVLVPSTPVSTCPSAPCPSWDPGLVAQSQLGALLPHLIYLAPALTARARKQLPGQASSCSGLLFHPSARLPGPCAVPGAQAWCLSPGVQLASGVG